jgi:predicted CopG family antitoxin
VSVSDEGYSNRLTVSVSDEGYSNILTVNVSAEGFSNLFMEIIPKKTHAQTSCDVIDTSI